MSHTALIKFAPVYTLERHNDPNWNREGRALYTSNSLRFKPGVTEIPLLVDHQDDRRVGTVHSLSNMQWVDGPWICALATVERPPPWLKRNETKCSFRIATMARGSFTDCELVRAALVSEVSILSPGVDPAEPLAQVLTFHRKERVAAPEPADEVFYGGGTIRRPNVGKVLALR